MLGIRGVRRELGSIASGGSAAALNCLTGNGLGISCSKGRFKLIYTLKRLSGLARAKQEVNSVNPTSDGRSAVLYFCLSCDINKHLLLVIAKPLGHCCTK